MVLVTGVAGLILIDKFLVLKENEEFGHISLAEISGNSPTPSGPEGRSGAPAGGG